MRPEGGVGHDGDALLFGETHERGLHEVGVVLDLQGGGADLGVAEEIEDERALEVGDANGLSQALADELLHSAPGLLDCSVGQLDVVLSVEGPLGRVSHGRVDVTQSDGEMDIVEIEVVDAPVGELLGADGADTLGVVEGVPELGDDKEVTAFHEAVGDGAGDALPGFGLVAVVCGWG